MKKHVFLLSLALLTTSFYQAQDTFSIVAVDTATGEVGSAGASCVDLFQTSLSNDDFLGQLFPGVGAINTQAYYIPQNQTNAANRMNMGETPTEIIDWLVANDVQNQPELRQYGIAAIINNEAQAAAHTGASTDDYKNHIIGEHYAIQGNILLGQEVLDSMEARFLRADGDLACKLMAALQGANMVGADTRCASNGTSSLFAFVKVAQPSDQFGSPSFLVSVRTADNAGIEPIDSLQIKFDQAHSCGNLGVTEPSTFRQYFKVFPNPTATSLTITNTAGASFEMSLIDLNGKAIYTNTLHAKQIIDASNFESGIYLLQLVNDSGTYVTKVRVE